jgi:hypothetical protein
VAGVLVTGLRLTGYKLSQPAQLPACSASSCLYALRSRFPVKLFILPHFHSHSISLGLSHGGSVINVASITQEASITVALPYYTFCDVLMEYYVHFRGLIAQLLQRLRAGNIEQIKCRPSSPSTLLLR